MAIKCPYHPHNRRARHEKNLLLLALGASALAHANEDAAQTAQTFAQALIDGDSAAAAALLAIPPGSADSANYRSTMQQCLAQMLTEQPLHNRRILSREARRDGGGYTVTLRVETPQGQDSMGIPLSHGADGWRVALGGSDLGCNLDASGFPDPASAATAYLQTLNGYDYGTPRIEAVHYRDDKTAAEVILSGKGHAVVPNPVEEPYRIALQTWRRGEQWVVDESCSGHCVRPLPLAGQ